MKAPIRKAVFPVAGLGTRFLPATKVIPKEMLPVVDKPVIQYAVEEAAAAGIEEFIFVTSHGKTAIEDHFEHHPELVAALTAKQKTAELDAIGSILPEGTRFSAVRQPQPLGLGHAVWCARDLVGDEPFAVILPDDVVKSEKSCIGQMVEVFSETGGALAAVMDVPREQTNRYGILDVASDDARPGGLAEIKGLVEKPDPADAPSTLSIIGRYILPPEIFGLLENGKTGAGGEIQLTDAMAELIGKMPFHGLRFRGTRFDCGDRAGWLAANIAFALDRPELGDKLRETMASAMDMNRQNGD